MFISVTKHCRQYDHIMCAACTIVRLYIKSELKKNYRSGFHPTIFVLSNKSQCRSGLCLGERYLPYHTTHSTATINGNSFDDLTAVRRLWLALDRTRAPLFVSDALPTAVTAFPSPRPTVLQCPISCTWIVIRFFRGLSF